MKEAKSAINILVIDKDVETRSGIERFFQLSGHRITSVADPSEAIAAITEKPEQDLVLFNTYASPPESFEIAYRLHCQPQIIKIPMVITSVHDHKFENLDDPSIDAFTVGYITEVTHLSELESLINCLQGFKKSD